MSDLQLFDYFRSSAAYRVRIALALKGLSYDHLGVHLVRNDGEHHAASYREINPQGLVPTLRDGTFDLTQSLAIMEYLNERFPGVSLLPDDLTLRARARQYAQVVACDIHPLNNLRVLKYLDQKLGADEDQRNAWIQEWIHRGFEAIERQLAADIEWRFCVGDLPTIADCCLVPQVFNARRFKVNLEEFPNILRVAKACDELAAFQSAHPSRQPDSE